MTLDALYGDSEGTSFIAIKVIFIFFFLFEAFIAGVLPAKLPICRKSQTVLGIMNAFAGGVFIAVALTHIMPEAANDYREYMEEHEHDHAVTPENDEHGDDDEFFPLPFVLVFVGYFILLMLDKVMFDSHSLHEHAHYHEHELAHLGRRESFAKVINEVK